MRTVSSHSELTPNHVPGSEMPALQQLAGAYDEHGQPLLFGLQTSGELVLVLHDPQVLTCWQRIDLTAQLAPGHDVHAKVFELAQKPDGSLRLAVIALVPHESPAYRLFFFDALAASADPAVWERALSQPVELDCGADLHLQEVHIGTQDQQSAAVVVRGEGTDRRPLHRMVNPDPGADGTWTWKPLPLPDGVKACHAIASGYLPQTPGKVLTTGFYAICDIGEDLPMLSFTSFPTGDEPPVVHPLYRMNDKRALATAATLDRRDGTRFTDLFTGGAFLYEYDIDAQRDPSVPPRQVADLADGVGYDASRITASIDPISGQRDVFTLSPPDGRLLRSRGIPTADDPGNAGIEWLPPVLLAHEVASCATWRHRGTAPGSGSTLYLAVGYQDGSLEVLYQDAVSGLWQRETVVLGGARTYTALNTFSTRVIVSDEANIPQYGVEVRITPEYPCSAFVDGRLTHFNALEPTVVATGADGSVTIIQRTESLGSPAFGARVDDGAEHEFRPDSTVATRLEGIRTRQDIQQARRSSGSPLFPDGKDDTSCDNALAGLDVLRKVHAELTGGSSGTGGWAPSVGSLARTATPLTSTAVTFGPAGPTVTVTEPSESDDDWLLTAAGDLFRWLWDAGETVVTWGINVLPDGTRAFFAKVGEVVWSFVVTVAAQILQATDWVLQRTLGLKLEDIVDWLGFVFDWQDIRDNHDAIRNTLLATLDHVIDRAGSVKPEIDRKADEIKVLIAQGLPTPTTPAAKELVASSSRDLSAKGPSPQDDVTGAHTPQAQWASGKISSYASFADIAETVIEEIEQDLADLGEHEQAILLGVVKEFESRILPHASELPFGELMGLLLELISDAVVDMLAEAAKTVVDVGTICFRAIRVLLDARIDVPVLTALYEEIIAPGSRLTLLDLACLVGSTFATVVFKVFAGENLYSAAQLAALKKPGLSFADVLAAYSMPRTVAGRSGPPDVADVFGGAIILTITAAIRVPLTVFWALQNIAGKPPLIFMPWLILCEMASYLLGMALLFLKIARSPNAQKWWFGCAALLPFLAFFIRARQIFNYVELRRGTDPPRQLIPLAVVESVVSIAMIVFQVAATVGQAIDEPAGLDRDGPLSSEWKVDISFAAIGNVAAGLRDGATAAQWFVPDEEWELIQLGRLGAQIAQAAAVILRASMQWSLAGGGVYAQFSGVI